MEPFPLPLLLPPVPYAFGNSGRVRSLPGGDIPIQHRALGIVRVVTLEVLGDELEFAARCLQSLAEFLRPLSRQRLWLRDVLRPPFREPAEIHRGAQSLSLGRYDEVTLLNELLPGDKVR
jgi:hypothetical protein